MLRISSRLFLFAFASCFLLGQNAVSRSAKSRLLTGSSIVKPDGVSANEWQDTREGRIAPIEHELPDVPAARACRWRDLLLRC